MLVQRKSPKKHTPGGAVSGHPCPPTSRACSGGSLTAHPCANSELARLLRATLRALPSTRSPRHRGPRLGGFLPQKQKQELASFLCRGERLVRRSAGMHGFVDQGAVRGAEHRRRCGSGPQGRGDGSPRLRSSTRTYCLRNPATPRSAGQSDSQDANQTTAVGAGLFGYFLGQAKK